MPIYEFKCLKCGECFELLMMRPEEAVETRCPKCGAEDFERILSCTNHNVGAGSGERRGASTTTRTCSSGSCTTYNIPGPNG